MTRTTPLRRTILQLRQIFFTEASTFMVVLSFVSLRPEYDAPARQVIRGELDRHLVAGQDADIVHAHLPRDMPQDDVSVFQLHAEGRVGESLHDLPLHLDHVFFGHSSFLIAYRVGNPAPLKFAFFSKLSYWCVMM